MPGKRSNANTRKSNKGIFSILATPFRELLKAGTNVADSTASTVVKVPTTAAKGVTNAARKTVKNLSHGVNQITDKAATGLNKTLGSIFNRKAGSKSRKTRKSNRK